MFCLTGVPASFDATPTVIRCPSCLMGSIFLPHCCCSRSPLSISAHTTLSPPLYLPGGCLRSPTIRSPLLLPAPLALFLERLPPRADAVFARSCYFHAFVLFALIAYHAAFVRVRWHSLMPRDATASGYRCAICSIAHVADADSVLIGSCRCALSQHLLHCSISVLPSLFLAAPAVPSRYTAALRVPVPVPGYDARACATASITVVPGADLHGIIVDKCCCCMMMFVFSRADAFHFPFCCCCYAILFCVLLMLLFVRYDVTKERLHFFFIVVACRICRHHFCLLHSCYFARYALRCLMRY